MCSLKLTIIINLGNGKSEIEGISIKNVTKTF